MCASAATPSPIPDSGPGHTLEIAHVLFADIVGYSKFPMDEQEHLVMQLQNAVRQVLQSVCAMVSEDFIRIPTGDGVALVFFRDAEAPVRCAIELSELLRNNSQIKLRMGIHSGPVYRVADINANRGVAGGGINIAQRVMDSGDAGHILLSNAEAEVLGQLSTWCHTLHDLGEVELKNGLRLKIHNLYNDKFGNPEIPQKIATQILTRETGSKTKLKKRYWRVSTAAAVLVLGFVSSWLFFTHKTHALSPTDTIVLADFSNMVGDEVFDDTLKESLRVSLSQSQFLNILSEAKVHQALRQMARPPDERLTHVLAREVCIRAASKAYLAGSITRVGAQYVIRLEAQNCASGDVLAREQVTAPVKDQVVAKMGEAATRLREELGESLSSVQRFDVPLAQATTSSLEALKAFSLARKRSSQKAIVLCKRAVKLDPTFAMAYDLLGNLYYNLNEPISAADNLKKAFDLRNLVTEEEQLKITADYYSLVTGELEKANEEYRLLITIYPLHPRAYDAHVDLGSNYMILGEYEKAAAETQEALRLSPLSVDAYSNLTAIYIAQNRFAAARTTIDQATNLKIELPNLNLYALAFLQGNVAVMKQQADAAVGNAGDDQMLSEESDTEAWYGRLGKARELSRQARNAARRSDGIESAALWQANTAMREALFGNTAGARQNASAALEIAPHSYPAEAQVALAYGLVGDVARARPVADDLAKRFPKDTVVQSVWLPTIRAQMETDRNNASRSVEFLESAAPYELGMQSGPSTKSCLYPVYIRAEAYLKMRQAAAAEAEFQRITGHAGLLCNCVTGALAHLGLARAYALQGDIPRARAAYQDFFDLWKDADRDIPILIAAKAEYAKLP
jgi:eukaryotic-like serine/threonine-protein kinase